MGEERRKPVQVDFATWDGGLDEAKASWIVSVGHLLRQIKSTTVALIGLVWLGHQAVNSGGMDGQQKLIAVCGVTAAVAGVAVTEIFARRGKNGTTEGTTGSTQP